MAACMPIGRRQCHAVQAAFDFVTPERPDLVEAWVSVGGYLNGDHIGLVWPLPPGSRRGTPEEYSAGVHPHIIIGLYRNSGRWAWDASCGWRTGKHELRQPGTQADSYHEALQQAKAHVASVLGAQDATLCVRRLLHALHASKPDELICKDR